MRFSIVGASKDTGEDVSITITAVDSRAAELVAHDRGILVEAIKLMPDDADTSPIAMDEDPLDAPPVPAGSGAAKTLGANNGDVDPYAEQAAKAWERQKNQAHDVTDLNVGTHYKVLINPNLLLLCSSVNRALTEGWEVQGGVATCVLSNATHYLQAMIHRPKAS